MAQETKPWVLKILQNDKMITGFFTDPVHNTNVHYN